MLGKRLGVVGVVVEDPAGIQDRLNKCISDAGSIIIGRMGVPHRERDVAVLALIVDGTADEINALTGRLGALPGVSVRSAMAKV